MKKALTIGELLITMTIIGTIAVLVLPSFMKDYHKKLYVTRLKKAYEILDSAVTQACLDNNVTKFSQTPYVLQDKNPATGKYYQQDFIDKYFKKANNQTTNPFSKNYGAVNAQGRRAVSLAEGHGWAKLAGGEAVSFYCGSGVNYCVMRVDINSTDGPNIGGRDMFAIFVDKDTNKLYDRYKVSVCGGVDSSEDTNRLTDSLYGVYQGYGCLNRIMEDNWEMKY
ncbi:MAG: type II secretion system GspH family protein [Muribaculaceae bacterium]|nr:type II secretion system GspH family protein [Muribaculaceae bacterium]